MIVEKCYHVFLREVAMGYVLGCLMAGLSFLLNQVLLKYTGLQTVISYSPLVEEVVKTLPAHYLGADLLLTHSVFGFLEAGYDWFTSRSGKIVPVMLSILGHSLFGGVTVMGRYFTGEIGWGLIGGVLAHVVWNITAIRLMSGKI
jgi:hypothetical protein